MKAAEEVKEVREEDRDEGRDEGVGEGVREEQSVEEKEVKEKEVKAAEVGEIGKEEEEEKEERKTRRRRKKKNWLTVKEYLRTVCESLLTCSEKKEVLGIKDVAEDAEISHPTAMKYITILWRWGIVEVKVMGRVYVLRVNKERLLKFMSELQEMKPSEVAKVFY